MKKPSNASIVKHFSPEVQAEIVKHVNISRDLIRDENKIIRQFSSGGDISVHEYLRAWERKTFWEREQKGFFNGLWIAAGGKAF